MTNKRHGFAPTLFVRIEKEDRTHVPFCVADTDIHNHAAMGETTKVGVYKLEDVVEVKGVPQIGKSLL